VINDYSKKPNEILKKYGVVGQAPAQ